MKYYTKEMIKLSKTIIIGLLIIFSIIFIKYKPMYHIKIGNQEIGDIEQIQNINQYIEEAVNLENKKNIAFISIKEKPSIEIRLVNRNIKNNEEEIKNKIKDNVKIEYTAYAITYQGENKVYVETLEQAEQIVEEIKKQDNLSYTKKLGILQVYANNLEEIKPSNLKKATKKISNVIKKSEQTNTVKVAKTNIKPIKKETSKINGIKFSTRPISGIITSRFGYRNSPGGIGSTNHKGLDISAPKGTVIKAAATGIVKFAGNRGSLGNLIIINNGKGVETYYAHCSKIYVSKGQKIKSGDEIGAVGQTGAATGPHLHFEVHINGTAVNPQKYIY